jgi:uncharacterized protein
MSARHSVPERLLLLPLRLPLVALVLAAGISLILGAQLPYLRKDIRIEKIFPQDDPRLADYQEFTALFGAEDRTILILLEVPEGESVLEQASLARIHSLTELLRHHPLVDERELVSLSRATLVRVGAALEIGPLYDPEGHPEHEHEWDTAGVEALLAGNPAFTDRLLSRDRRLCAFLVPLDPGQPNDEELRRRFASEIPALVRADLRPGERVWFEGFAYTNHEVLALMSSDQRRFYPLSFGLLFLTLGLVFRRLTPTFLAVLSVGLASIWTLGLMAWLDFPLSFMSAAVPVMVVVVCVGDAVHLITRYHQLLGQALPARTALQRALVDVGRACFFTSVTTAAGFLALSTSQVEIVRELGAPVAMGVLMAYLATFLVLPPLLAWAPAPPPGEVQAGVRALAPAMRGLARQVRRRPGLVTALFGVATLISLLLLPRLEQTTRLLSDFDDDEPLMATRLLFEERMGGVAPLEVVIDCGTPGRAIDPDVQRGLLKLSQRMRSQEMREQGVLYALSLADFLSDAYFTFYDRDPAYRGALPDSAEALAQVHFLYWGLADQDATADYVDRPDAPRFLRLQLRIENLYTPEFFALVAAVESEARECLPDDVQVKVTGNALMAQATHDSLISDMGRSFLLAFGLVALLVLVSFRSWRLALLALIPNLLPILFVFAFMSLTGIALKLTTSIVFTIVFGLSVDDTIHFVAGLEQRTRDSGKTGGDPVTATIRETGLSLVLSSVVLVLGFSVLGVSHFKANRYFGLLVALTCVFALLGDLLLLPALLWLRDRRRRRST